MSTPKETILCSVLFQLGFYLDVFSTHISQHYNYFEIQLCKIKYNHILMLFVPSRESIIKVLDARWRKKKCLVYNKAIKKMYI